MVCSGYRMCLAQAVGVVGLLFSGLAIAPLIVSYYVDMEWSVVQPSVKQIHEMLENEFQKQVITELTLENLKTFLEGFTRNIETAVVTIAVLGSMNICMNVSMLIGSCCNVRLLFKALMSSNNKYVSKQLSATALANYIHDAACHHLDSGCNIFRPTWSLSLCSGMLRVGGVKYYPHIFVGPCLALSDNYDRPSHPDYPLCVELGHGHVYLHIHADRYWLRGKNYTIKKKNLRSRRLGSSLLGLCLLDPPLGPPSTCTAHVS